MNPSEELSITLTLLTEASDDAGLEQRHEAAMANVVDAGARRTSSSIELGSLTALVDRLDFEGSPRRLHVVSVLHGRVHVLFFIQSKLGPRRPDDRAVEGLIDELLAGLELGPPEPAMEQLGARFVDRRSGFVVTAPSESPPRIAEHEVDFGRGYVATWAPEATLLVTNGSISGYTDDEVLDRGVADLAREFEAAGYAPAPASERTVAGQAARSLRWTNEDGVTAYTVLFIRRKTQIAISRLDGDAEAFDRMVDSFEFLD
jgi:hypothetical protein